jgi:hypothetical protein
MTPEDQLIEAARHDQAESLTLEQSQTLYRAVAKVVILGAEKGVTITKMIELLKSGLTVAELLEYLRCKTGGTA